ncbi:MAG: hypothetical protein Tsb0019_26650 [Roseibium sp.]
MAVVALLGGGLGGCSQISVPVGSNNVDTPTLLTGSIPSAADVAYSDVDEEDRGIIAAKFDSIGLDLGNSEPASGLTLPWLNALSGNSGTLSGIDSTTLAATGCLTFRTTANTIAGIKLYEGTACRDVTGRFAVTALNVAGA